MIYSRVREYENSLWDLKSFGTAGSYKIRRLESDLASATATTRQNKAGEPLPAASFPKEMRPLLKGERYRKFPEIFSAGGYWVVSAHFAAVMQRHDLSRTSFYPVSFFQSNMKTRVEGDFFHLNFAETKDAFDPENSIKSEPLLPDVWLLGLAPKDNEIAVNRSALNGVNLWIAPRLRHAVFMSDRLVQELRKEKLTRRLGLRKCIIV